MRFPYAQIKPVAGILRNVRNIFSAFAAMGTIAFLFVFLCAINFNPEASDYEEVM